MSIRTRLTLWYVGLLAVTLLVFSALLYGVLHYYLWMGIDRALQSRAAQIEAYIQSTTDPVSLLVTRSVPLPPIDVFSTPGIYVQILNNRAEIAGRSANLGDQFLPIDQKEFHRNLLNEPTFYVAKAGDTRLRIYSAPLKVTDLLKGEQIIGVVQVGESLHGVDTALRTILYLLMGGGALALLTATLVGALMAGAALRPIDDVAMTARRISQAEDLSQRLAAPAHQDEVGRLTATFNAMLERLERLFVTQQRLVADVSHDLRTPLTTIRGNIDLLRRGAADDDQARAETLDAIEGEVTRMARLVADLLLLAQADAGIRLEKKPVELDTLLLDVYRQAQLMADGVEVRLGHEDQAVVMGDADRLRQLLLNLVDNALKYTPRGGEVKLSLYREPGWVQVAVTDTGIGIPKEDLPHIFERFYRADKARSGRRGGAGLGLSIARWIAEEHGGHLTVESEVGRGSTFTLWLRPGTGPPDESEGEDNGNIS